MHAPTSAVFALACVVVGRLLMQDNRPFSADDATSWLSVACYLAAVVGSGLAIHVAVTAYVELNLCSQLAALVALDTCAHLVDLSLAPQTAAARIVLAAVAVSVSELAASAWQIRRAEVETIYRIKKVSMILGVVAACVTWIHVIRIFLDTGPS
jgi:uncharacterized membrane protein YkvI